MCASSAADSAAAEKGLSVTWNTDAPVFWCRVVPQASAPGAKFAAVTVEALQVPVVAMALTTAAVGTAGVSGLPIKECRIDSDCKPLGVTEHVQQAISSSAGSKAYKFRHRLAPLEEPV